MRLRRYLLWGAWMVSVATWAQTGVTGTVTTGANTFGSTDIEASLTGQTGRLVISVDGGYERLSKRETWSSEDLDRTIPEINTRLTGYREGEDPVHQWWAKLSASYDLDSLNLLSASLGGFLLKHDMLNNGHVTLFNNARGETFPYGYRESLPNQGYRSWNGKLDYQHLTSRPGEMLTLSYMLSLSRRHEDTQTDYFDEDGNSLEELQDMETTVNRFTEHTFQADWVRPLGGGHQLELGVKHIYRFNHSHFTDYILAGGVIDHITPYIDDPLEHVTRVTGAYADYLFQTVRWTLQAGLRYEHTYLFCDNMDAAVENFTHHQNHWLPQACVTWRPTDRQTLTLSYASSVQRPGIHMLNSAITGTPTMSYLGNPNLIAANTYAVALGYQLETPRLTLRLTPAYKFANDGLTTVEVNYDEIRVQTYDNGLCYRSFQIGQNVEWKPFASTAFELDNTVVYAYNDHTSRGYTNDSWTDEYNVNLRQQLPWKLHLTLGAEGQIGRKAIDAYSRVHSWYNYHASLERSFLKDDRLTVSIDAKNIFNRTLSVTNSIINGGFSERNIVCTRGRQFGIRVAYRFGSLRTKVWKAEHTIENNDEIGGIYEEH